MQENIYSGFTNKYTVSKTVRFALQPQGRTQEYVEKSGVLSVDEKRVEEYQQMKKLLDEFYKQYIEDALATLELKDLDTYCELYSQNNKTEKEQKALEAFQKKLRKNVVECLQDGDAYKGLFKGEIITTKLAQNADAAQTELIAKFAKFTTYFQGFFENRKNMFSDEAKSTAISYRIIHENLPKFIDNIRVFEKILNSELTECIGEIEEDLKNELNGRSVKDFFNIIHYCDVVTNRDTESFFC